MARADWDSARIVHWRCAGQVRTRPPCPVLSCRARKSTRDTKGASVSSASRRGPADYRLRWDALMRVLEPQAATIITLRFAGEAGSHGLTGAASTSVHFLRYMATTFSDVTC